jgi:RHS repeat-associated protein
MKPSNFALAASGSDRLLRQRVFDTQPPYSPISKQGSAKTSASRWPMTKKRFTPGPDRAAAECFSATSGPSAPPRKLTQANGQTAWQWAYSAFGDEQPTIAAKRFTSETTNPTTGATSTPEVTFNLRYPGQYLDKETKLHYNYYRSYDSRTGRYTQWDPIGLNGGWNRFGYAGELSFFDPTALHRATPSRRVIEPCWGGAKGKT